MQQKTLNAELRTTGSGNARRARRAGGIPGVVYGHSQPVSVLVSAREFDRSFHTINESELISLAIGKNNHDVIVKDYQQDITTGRIVHIDFYEVERGKKLRTHVPITFLGSPVGIREGGVVETHLHEFDVECLPSDIVDHIDIEIGQLAVGQSIHVRDIAPPQGIKFLNTPDQVIIVVATVRGAVEDTEEGAEEGASEV